VSSAAGRNGGFRLFVGAPEDEHLPVLSVVAAVGLEPEPPEKVPVTAKGVTKAHGLSLLVDMIRGSGGSPIGRLTSVKDFRSEEDYGACAQLSSAVQHCYLFQQVIHSSQIDRLLMHLLPLES
jgi:hypothetical protein